MNFKYTISLGALVALTGTSCWGAAPRKTVLEELPEELVASIIEQVGPDYWEFMAMANPGFNQDVRHTMDMAHPGALELLQRNNGDMQAALFDAAKINNPWAVRYLVRHGADVNAEKGLGLTPLMIAAGLGFGEVVTELLNNGALINKGDEITRTALEAAVYAEQIEMVKQLLKAGANPNGKNCRSPLYVARKIIQNKAIATLLQQAGGQMN